MFNLSNVLYVDDSDDDGMENSADRELFAKFRVGERRVSTVYRVGPHVDTLHGTPASHAAAAAATGNMKPLTETLNRSKSDGILFEHSESERNFKAGE